MDGGDEEGADVDVAVDVDVAGAACVLVDERGDTGLGEADVDVTGDVVWESLVRRRTNMRAAHCMRA